MQPNIPENENDLNDVEKRLARWLPAADGLNTDAMLYAAGLAAGRRGRIVWPIVCVVLLAQAIGLGMWGFSERTERRELAARLDKRSPAPGHSPETAVVELPAPAYIPSPNDYFQLRRQAEQDSDDWLAVSIPPGRQAIGPPPPEPASPTAGQRTGLSDL